MTKKEIVRRAICHEDVPEIPYAVSFVEAELEKMVHYYRQEHKKNRYGGD